MPHAATMTPPDTDRATPSRLPLAWLALLLALVCGLAELSAGPGYRLGWWGLGAGLKTMQWAAIAAALALLIAVFAFVTATRRGARHARRVALAALVLGVIVVAPPAAMLVQLYRLPRIHDVSTDTENPPRFVAVLPLRQHARNPVEPDPAAIAQQRRGYPDLRPARLHLPPAQALQRAEQVARSMGWEIVDVSPQDLRLEATATTLLFGFKDDVVVRVTPQGSGSRVDLRSLSRVGGSDFGANAARIRGFVDRIEAGE
ncbi:MAG TPA: DUF1499 domain-containing protein [Albitalea sp.]|nr:DUF1499 domain-containing protein [Albitalea sp.]